MNKGARSTVDLMGAVGSSSNSNHKNLLLKSAHEMRHNGSQGNLFGRPMTGTNAMNLQSHSKFGAFHGAGGPIRPQTAFYS